jgi:formylglycine-generating enzyme required for sulfatase activity
MKRHSSIIKGFCFLILFLTIILHVSCGRQKKEVKQVSDSIPLNQSLLTESAEQGPPPVSDTPGQGNLPKIWISKTNNAEMILIPGGNFIYGISKRSRDSILKVLSTANLEIFSKEFRLKNVYLPSYYIDKTEVTNAQYNKFIQATGHRTSRFRNSRMFNAPDQPVVGVGWEDALAYAKWAGKRLPSEEEWEKAARGTDGRMFPWGNTVSSDNYNGKNQGYYAPVKVGSFIHGASPYGVMDMAGNVYEMTIGKWGENSHAMRGGCFLNSGAYVRTMFRWAMDDEVNGAEWLGFRCVMDTIGIKGR